MAVVATLVVGLALMLGSVKTLLPFAGWYLFWSIAPAVAIVGLRPRRWILGVVLVLCVVALVLSVMGRQKPGLDPFDERHDGGVVATAAATHMVLDGRNPYTADFTEALAPTHDVLDADPPIVNPLVEHYPYLPLAFLVHVPVTATSGLVHLDPDPRVLYAVAVLGAAVVLVRRNRPGWARAAALLALAGNGAVVSYLAWGANDAAAASLLVIGAYVAWRRPIVGGLLVAVAMSLKVLLLVALLPVGVLMLAKLGRRPTTMLLASSLGVVAVTSLPFLVLAPHDFLQDTIAFNLGRTDRSYPTSGVGLGALAPGVFTDGVILLSSLALLAAVCVVGLRVLRRFPTVSVALFVSGTLVLAGLIPARSFQMSYFPLMVVLWAPIWADVGSSWGRNPTDLNTPPGRAKKSDQSAAESPI